MEKQPKRNAKQKEQHKIYMREYYRNNKEQREKNNNRIASQRLVKAQCKYCAKQITTYYMARHIKKQHL